MEVEQKKIEREQKKMKNKIEKMKKVAMLSKSSGALNDDISRTGEEVTDVCLCPICGCVYGADDTLWIGCDNCDNWYNLSCVGVTEDNIPEVFYCPKCTVS